MARRRIIVRRSRSVVAFERAANMLHPTANPAQLRWIGSKMEHVRRAFEGDNAASATDTDSAPRHGFGTPLNDARRVLRAALISKFDAGSDEQNRVAEILRRAADEIVGKKR